MAEDEIEEQPEVVAGHSEGGGGGEVAAALLEAIALAARIHVLLVEASPPERRAVEARRRQAVALVADWPGAPEAARRVGFEGPAKPGRTRRRRPSSPRRR